MTAFRNALMAAAMTAGFLGAGTGGAQAHWDRGYGPPRGYYAPPPPVFYGPPRGYFAPPPPVYYAPRPVYVPPPPVFYGPPRHHYGRGHGWGHHRRW